MYKTYTIDLSLIAGGAGRSCNTVFTFCSDVTTIWSDVIWLFCDVIGRSEIAGTSFCPGTPIPTLTERPPFSTPPNPIN